MVVYRVVNEKRYRIDPVPAPRQNRMSRFNPSKAKAIARYHAFCDLVRLSHVEIPPSCYLRFEIAVPKKGHARIGKPHAQRGDLDNFVKSVLDAALLDDAHVHRILAEKVWALRGAIIVGELVVEEDGPHE